MGFLKKYWWAILLVVLAVFAYYWFMMRETSTPKTPTNTNGCKTPVADWNAALEAKKTEIRTNADWLAYVTSQASQLGISVEQSITDNAIFDLVENQKMCNPTA